MSNNFLNIGLIGCGSMGMELADAVYSGEVGDARITAVLDEVEANTDLLAKTFSPKPNTFKSFEQFITAQHIDLVVECASQKVIHAYGVAIVKAGISILIMSSGALLDPVLFHAIFSASKKSGARITIPSGAVGGIDALRAVQKDLDEVTIVSTKNPMALSGAPGFQTWEQFEFNKPTIVFDGTANEAVKLFPTNVNVAATVSLAGIGPEKTNVKIVADNNAPGNVHEIQARGRFGEFNFRLINRPHPKNIKTSHLAVMAAIESLKSFVNPSLRIGT